MRDRATPRQTFWIGVAALAGGSYLGLVGLGVLPIPGGPRNLHGPLWLVLAIGLAVTLAGLSALLQVAGGANDRGELPEHSPRWLRVVQYLIVVVLFLCFAAVGSWIAFGGGERHFSGTLMLFGAHVDEWIGRVAFGFGALITWAAAIAVAVIGARKLLGRNNPT